MIDPLFSNKKYPERKIRFVFLAFTQKNGTLCHCMLCTVHPTALNKIRKTMESPVLYENNYLSIFNFVCDGRDLEKGTFFDPFIALKCSIF